MLRNPVLRFGICSVVLLLLLVVTAGFFGPCYGGPNRYYGKLLDYNPYAGDGSLASYLPPLQSLFVRQIGMADFRVPSLDDARASINLYSAKTRYEDRKGSWENYWVGIAANKNETAAAGFSRISLELRTNFVWQTSTGIYDLESRGRTGNGFGCTELDVLGSDPLKFYAFCAQQTGGGLNVFVSSHDGNHGTKFYPDTWTVDLQIRHETDELVFGAKLPTAAIYDEIDRLSIPSMYLPLFPSIGAAQLPGGTQWGFDNFMLTQNDPIQNPTREQIWLEDWTHVFQNELGAMHRLDGPNPDWSSARTLLQAAGARFDGLDLELQDIRANLHFKKTKDPTKLSAKRLKKSAKSLGKILKSVEKQKKPAKIVKKLLKLYRVQVQALTGVK